MVNPSNDVKPIEETTADPKSIKIYGGELVVIAIVAFVSLLLITILSYRFFVMERIKKSDEFFTASTFVNSAEYLNDYFLDTVENLKLDDITFSENQQSGYSVLIFKLRLKNDLTERVAIELFKVADFWIVNSVILSPGTIYEYELTPTYALINIFFEKLFYGDVKTAASYLKTIEDDNRDPHLNDYLKARLAIAKGNYEFALQLLKDLELRVFYGRVSVVFAQGLAYFNQEKYELALTEFQRALSEKDSYKKQFGKNRHNRDFIASGGLLFAQFNHEMIHGEVLNYMAQTHFHLKQFQEALNDCNEGIKIAGQIKSRSLASSLRYVKALNLFQLNRWDEAIVAFDEVIQDIDNSNLVQKAWSYYYKGKIGDALRQYHNIYDYFERAVSLDPSNAMIRLQTIQFLMNRNFPGDLEIALSLALRGIQYEVQKDDFRNLSSRLYQRLNLKDKSASIQ